MIFVKSFSEPSQATLWYLMNSSMCQVASPRSVALRNKESIARMQRYLGIDFWEAWQTSLRKNHHLWDLSFLSKELGLWTHIFSIRRCAVFLLYHFLWYFPTVLMYFPWGFPYGFSPQPQHFPTWRTSRTGPPLGVPPPPGHWPRPGSSLVAPVPRRSLPNDGRWFMVYLRGTNIIWYHLSMGLNGSRDIIQNVFQKLVVDAICNIISMVLVLILQHFLINQLRGEV